MKTQMKTYDVIIAGGGIIGGAIAFELARHQIRVLVIDRQSPGQESSWAAAGMLSPAPDSDDAIPLVPLARASMNIYPDFVSAVESASGLSADSVRTEQSKHSSMQTRRINYPQCLPCIKSSVSTLKSFTSKTRRFSNLTSAAKSEPPLFYVRKLRLIIAR